MAAASVMAGSALATSPAARKVMLVSADVDLRQRLRASLSGMRWQVLEAGGGAEAIVQVEQQPVEAVLVDAWLPDLEAGEFAMRMLSHLPGLEVIRLDGTSPSGSVRSARRHELLHALREASERSGDSKPSSSRESLQPSVAAPPRVVASLPGGIDELVGRSAAMTELARLIRLVAPRTATVLIEGETGTGKELVAKALHRLSARSHKPFVVMNCAAIPESLLEAELFGHTRGAFTGADRARTGRIETAHGGTLFLDEIGEMPLALQAKMLRFLENGEIQRVGENEIMRVDVRVIAATHQDLEKRTTEGAFRLDLYHRLAVFPLAVPALRDRTEDIEELAEHFLALLGRQWPRKALRGEALALLQTHPWPGNVRELAHVLERASILAGDEAAIGTDHVWLRRQS